MNHQVNLKPGVFEVTFDETQSKAFWKSIKIMPIDFLSSKASLHFENSLETFTGWTANKVSRHGV